MSKNKKAEIKKEEIKTFLLHPWRTFGFEAFLFSLSLGSGILAGLKLNKSRSVFHQSLY